MRRLDKEIKDPAILNEILYQSQVVRIAFSIDNIPHIIPLSYGYKNNKLFIHSATQGSKIEMIKQNDYICFEMELFSEVVKDKLACNWTTKYRSIIGWGRISIVNKTKEKIDGLNVIMEKYGERHNHTYHERSLENMVLLIIEIDHFTGKQSGEWK